MGILYFATHNENKIREAKDILGIEIEGAGFEVDEIQSMDPVEVAVKKAKEYFKLLNKPIFTEDISLSINALGGLPGPYIDSFMKVLGNDGIIALLKGKADRRVTAQATIVYIDEEGEKIFIGKEAGTIPNKPKGVGFGWDPIFVPKGEKNTFADMDLKEKNKFSMRAIALLKLKKFLYKNNRLQVVK
jgi:XTP/dITP diphosphohydrolase